MKSSDYRDDCGTGVPNRQIRFSRRAIVVVGSSELLWPAFWAAVRWMHNYLPSIPRLSAVFDGDRFYMHIACIFEHQTQMEWEA